MLRKVAREIGRQLDAAIHNLMTPQRMAARIANRYRDAREIRDMGAWLLTVAIVPRGCGQVLCEDGRVWPTGEPCPTCTTNRQVTSEWWRRARAWGDQLAELRARRASDTATVRATYRQRSAASDEEVLAVAAAHGPATALHVYGVYRAGPVLRAQYGHQPAAVGALLPLPRPVPPVPCHPSEEAPMPDRHGYMPAGFRTAVGRAQLEGALAIACPQPGCLAEEGQPCTTQRGRRRAPHEARTTAAETRGEES